jgi:hypothetical protein
MATRQRLQNPGVGRECGLQFGESSLGCSAVTRHDARLSLSAGFKGRELSALWRRIGAGGSTSARH